MGAECQESGHSVLLCGEELQVPGYRCGRKAEGNGVKQIFTSFCNPKGNADTERFFRTLKEDLIWPREFETYAELDETLTNWIKSYNEDFPHSAIGYQTPEQYEKNYTFNHQLNNQNILQVLH